MPTERARAEAVERLLYGPNSIFTPEEQAAMRRGYTMDERKRISGQVFSSEGGPPYPQAISQEHADKLNRLRFERIEPEMSTSPQGGSYSYEVIQPGGSIPNLQQPYAVERRDGMIVRAYPISNPQEPNTPEWDDEIKAFLDAEPEEDTGGHASLLIAQQNLSYPPPVFVPRIQPSSRSRIRKQRPSAGGTR